MTDNRQGGGWKVSKKREWLECDTEGWRWVERKVMAEGGEWLELLACTQRKTGGEGVHVQWKMMEGGKDGVSYIHVHVDEGGRCTMEGDGAGEMDGAPYIHVHIEEEGWGWMMME